MLRTWESSTLVFYKCLLSSASLLSVNSFLATSLHEGGGEAEQKAMASCIYLLKWCEGCSFMSDSLWPHRLYSPWNSPGQNTGVSNLSLLQGIFLTQGSNPGIPHCRQILYQLNYKGSPAILEWVAYPFSSRSSWPRDWTRVSCIPGGFFTNWAIREALNAALEFLLVYFEIHALGLFYIKFYLSINSIQDRAQCIWEVWLRNKCLLTSSFSC